jgi:hypothetical protein
MNAPDPTRSCKLYGSGFTAIHDIAFNKRTGQLYVYELAAEGVLAYEEGFGTGVFPSAVLLEVNKSHKHRDDDRHDDGRRELAAGELSQPGGVVVDKNGAVYVTDGMFTGGRLLKVVERD